MHIPLFNFGVRENFDYFQAPQGKHTGKRFKRREVTTSFSHVKMSPDWPITLHVLVATNALRDILRFCVAHALQRSNNSALAEYLWSTVTRSIISISPSVLPSKVSGEEYKAFWSSAYVKGMSGTALKFTILSLTRFVLSWIFQLASTNLCGWLWMTV